MVIEGILLSSIKYRFFKEGRAINTNNNDGKMVQIVSISCPSIINLLNLLTISKDNTKYKVRIVIVIKTIMVWSWKNIMCSIKGEEASWKDKAIHVGID